jgi:ribulose-phosphate 3-epimerase
MLELKIVPSILSADFGRLNEEIASIEDVVDVISVDVMDGHFVPNMTIGAPVLKWLKSSKPFECHLMITDPADYIDDFVKAGATWITIHVEAAGEKTGELLEKIRAAGCKPSLAISPPTPVEAIEPYLDQVDMVVVMSVNPGFGGQSFMPEVLTKVERVRQLQPELDICMDGGINAETGQQSADAGANVFVAGSYIFKAEDRLKAIESLRNIELPKFTN